MLNQDKESLKNFWENLSKSSDYDLSNELVVAAASSLNQKQYENAALILEAVYRINSLKKMAG